MYLVLDLDRSPGPNSTAAVPEVGLLFLLPWDPMTSRFSRLSRQLQLPVPAPRLRRERQQLLNSQPPAMSLALEVIVDNVPACGGSAEVLAGRYVDS